MNEYVPSGVEGVVDIVILELPDAPDDIVTEVALSDAVGPLLTTGETDNPPTWKPTCTWLLTLVSTSAMSTPLTQIFACQ